MEAMFPYISDNTKTLSFYGILVQSSPLGDMLTPEVISGRHQNPLIALVTVVIILSFITILAEEPGIALVQDS